MIKLYPFILFVIFCFFELKGQDVEVLKEQNVEISMRVNYIANVSSGSIYRTFDTFTYQQNIKQKYYYGGISVVNKRPNDVFYRLRFDYFYYNAEYSFRAEQFNGDYNLLDGDYNITGIQFTPGIGKFLKYKFLSFKIGAEASVYVAGQGKREERNQNFYSSGGNDEFKIYSEYPKGAYIIGLAMFYSIEYNFLNDFALIFELSSGIYYSGIKGTIESTYEYYNTSGQLYNTKINKDEIDDKGIITDLISPSIGLSYKF